MGLIFKNQWAFLHALASVKPHVVGPIDHDVCEPLQR